mgnify:CR=1 FL=1
MSPLRTTAGILGIIAAPTWLWVPGAATAATAYTLDLITREDEDA